MVVLKQKGKTMRLIDADALKDLLKEYCVDGDSIVQTWYCTMGIDDCIDNAPTVDIVRHGYWTERYMEDDECRFTRRRWYCSECGKWQTYGKSDYCLNCGAKMDGARVEREADEK